MGLNQIKMGAVISYLSLALGIITGMLYTPWMVGKIGQSDYGLYTLASSLIAIFMIDFGLGSAVSRFVSKYRAEGDQKSIDSIIGVVFKLYFAIDLIILFVLIGIYFFLDVIYVKLTVDELEKFRIIYLIVAGFNLFSFPMSPLNGILNAYERFVQLKLCDMFNKLFTVALVIVALSYTASVTVVVAANVVSGVITIIAKLVIVKKSLPLRINFRTHDKELYRSLFGFTAWTTVISIMHRFTHSFAPSVLGMTANSIEIAIYSPAVVLEGYYWNIATAVNGLFLPRVSKFVSQKNDDEILKLMIKVGRYQIIVLGLVFIGFICVGKDFMVLWMGPDYSKTYYCTLIMLFPTLISCSQQIASTTVIAKNLIKYEAKCMLITGVLGLFISYVLSMHFGAIGVCIGAAVTGIVNTVFMNVIYHKKAGLNIFEFYKKCYLKAVPCYIIAVLLGLLIVKAVSIGGWIGLVVKILLITIIYVVSLFMFYFSNTERINLFNKLKKR